MRRMSKWSLAITVMLSVLLAGCQSTYYSAMEKVGIHKRDIMVDRIESTQDAQQDAQEQFKSALEQFQNVVNFEGGDLEKLYNQLNDEYEDSLAATEKVRGRIDDIKSVSDALFDEWEHELELYTNKSLKRSSANKLEDTRRRYNAMINSLEKSERQMQSVLNAFQDQTLYLKHNLNARAISALKGEFNNIKSDIDRLIEDMQSSIDESSQFINALKSS